jgi:hypothetical protein
MQDMISEASDKHEIMETLAALVEEQPGSVQEHDLQRIAMQQLNQDDPWLVLLTLRLFSVCQSAVLRNIWGNLLGAIHRVLNKPHLLYPEIIEMALTVINNLGKHFDLSEFVRKAEIYRFIHEVQGLLGDDPRGERLEGILQSLTTTCS